ncbi:MAG: hypothetical protein F6K58_11830 [Symploca sp. SIO2E9]|nr:hypothetical protein [Symploca sp. SIO2E9]
MGRGGDGETRRRGDGEMGRWGEGEKELVTVMIIDQFEECFTMSEHHQRQEFFDGLIDLLDNLDNLYVLIGIRSDFRGRLREYPQLVERINRPYINVEHLSREEIEEAIAKPAKLVGLGIEGALQQQLINDVEDYPGSLPLLQYTLTELWKQSRQQQEKFLRLETYRKLGGIEGTLEKRANQVFDSLSRVEQAVARRLFLELTQVGDTLDTRRRVRLGELVNSHHSLEILDVVSEKLASKDNRLITRSNEENSQDVVLDVVHEALIRHWGRLLEWKQSYREAMVVERKLEAAAQEWQEKGKRRDDAGLLLQGGRLVEAEEYLETYDELGMLNGLAEEYIQVSRQKHKQMNRNRKLVAGGFIGVLVLGTVVSTYLWLDVRRQARKAEESEIEVLNELTKEVWRLKQPFEALKESLKIVGKLQKADWIKGDTRVGAIGNLRQSLYGVKEFNSLDKHSHYVNSVAFSRDGNTIASASSDNTVKVWNREGKLLHTFSRHSDSVNSVAFSRDGKTIASASDDKTVKVWNREGKLLHTLSGHSDSVNSVAFSRDGNTIASASWDKTVKVWNREGKLLHTLTGHSDVVNSVAFSRDGNTITSASDDKTVKVWNLEGKLLHTLTGHSDIVYSVAFSRDGKTIASASGDKTVKVWNLEGKLLHTLTGHSDGVISVAFSRDGKTIASASDDKTVKVWNLQGKLLHTLTGHNHYVNSVAFSRDGNTIASASSDKTVKVWNRAGKLLHTLTGHNHYVNSVAFSPNGKTIASASWDNTIKVWNLQGKLLHTLTGHSHYVNSVAFSRDGNTIASASWDKTVKVWNREGKLLHTLTGHSHYVNSVAFSRDGNTIASASWDKTVKVWNREGKLLHTLTGHSDVVNSVAFSRDGNTIASASRDKTVKVWNREGKLLNTLTGHSDLVISVAFSRDGNTIASASSDKTVILWNFDLNDLVQQSCDWLHEYLVTHKDEEELRKICKISNK